MITQTNGDALHVLPGLEAQRFQSCITSPPYYALRDYSIEGQIGLEPSADKYIANLVKIFDQVWRVLRQDGILWVNISDSYAGSGKGRNKHGIDAQRTKPALQEATRGAKSGILQKTNTTDARAKSRMAIPERFVLAMMNAGWIYRQEIIWAKSAPIPESVKDRPTTAHEKIFMFVKQGVYYSNMDALAEPCKYRGHEEKFGAMKRRQEAALRGDPEYKNGHKVWDRTSANTETRNARSVWTLKNDRIRSAHIATFPKDLARRCILASTKTGDEILDPFSGAGTTGIVGASMGRRAFLIDLNPDYVAEAQLRIDGMQSGLI